MGGEVIVERGWMNHLRCRSFDYLHETGFLGTRAGRRLRLNGNQRRLEGYLHQLESKHLVKVVCMDLATVYRAMVHKHFPNARIVADTSFGSSVITSSPADASWIRSA